MIAAMTDLHHLRRAGGDALRALVELLPAEWDPRNGEEEISIVFADVSGYSSFVARHGDDAALSVLAALEQAVTRTLAARKGARVVKRLGDGIMISAREAHDGVAIAAELVERFAAAAAEHDWRLSLRSGVHRGIVRRQNDDFIGYHVNVAARVAEAAPPGRAFATGAALEGVDCARLGWDAVRVGRLRAKGVQGPVDLRLLRRPAHVRRAS